MKLTDKLDPMLSNVEFEYEDDKKVHTRDVVCPIIHLHKIISQVIILICFEVCQSNKRDRCDGTEDADRHLKEHAAPRLEDHSFQPEPKLFLFCAVMV